jgi:hypothetical protein
MRKALSTLLLLLVCFNVFAQKILKQEKVTKQAIHIVGSNFECVVFNKNYDGWYPEYDGKKHLKGKFFTPTNSQILLVEKLLYSQIKDIDSTHKYRNGLDIFSKWEKYRRQYICYIDSNGDKVFFVNSFPADEKWAFENSTDNLVYPEIKNIPKWYWWLVFVMDGGDNYWKVKVDLKAKKLFDFHINGSPV